MSRVVVRGRPGPPLRNATRGAQSAPLVFPLTLRQRIEIRLSITPLSLPLSRVREVTAAPSS